MKKAILIVSFGTTYTETRIKNITAIKNQVAMLYPDAIIEEAVSSRIVRNHMIQDEHIDAKSPLEALISLKEQGATHVVVFPTHVIDGIENNQMKNAVEESRSFFEKIIVADALLTNVDDYTDVSKALLESLKESVGDSPLIFMGHGTEHVADESYVIIEQALRAYASHPVYIATVEGKRTIEDVIRQMKEEGIVNTRVVLAPFMLVAGDHANNDMAGESDSFASILKNEGYLPECILKGIGEYPAVRQVYLSHLQKAVTELEDISDKQSGILYGIGVGTGNPKQMTLQELEVIKACDLIVIPAVSKEECYAYRIAEQAYPEISEKPVLCMPFPMIKDEGKLEISHNKIYENIEGYLCKGQKVGMLTIGDPSIYSTYMYMHKRAKANGWRAEIVSGVPSFCSVAARLGISLGEKNEEIHIIPSAYKAENTFSYNGTCVYMKSGRGLKELISALRLRQETTKELYEISAVANCGMSAEKVYHGLDELETVEGYLTTVIVKKINN